MARVDCLELELSCHAVPYRAYLTCMLCPAIPLPDAFCHALSFSFLPNPSLSFSAHSCSFLYPTLPFPILPCPFLPFPFLPCPFLSYPAHSCPSLSYPTLPCPSLTCSTFPLPVTCLTHEVLSNHSYHDAYAPPQPILSCSALPFPVLPFPCVTRLIIIHDVTYRGLNVGVGGGAKERVDDAAQEGGLACRALPSCHRGALRPQHRHRRQEGQRYR